jgi:dGTP triphosphohydrolase
MTNIPERLRLKETHPLYQKVEKLFELADELGLSFQIYYNSVFVYQKDDSITYNMEDIEDGQTINELPPRFEWKITCENPKYTKAVQEEQKAYEKVREEKKIAEEKARLAKEAEETRLMEEKIKRQELQQLKVLLNKYGKPEK